MPLAVHRTPGETFAGYTELETKVCPVCGVLYAAPAMLFEKKHARRSSAAQNNWYCPNGHSLVFTETEADRLARELESEKQRAQSRLDLLRQEERSHAATRGHLTRVRNEKARLIARVANGVCPCCNRTFKQLAQHMARQHPQYVDQASVEESADASA